MVEIIVSIGLLVIYMGYLLVVGVNIYKRLDKQDKTILFFIRQLNSMQEEINQLRSSVYIGDDGK